MGSTKQRREPIIPREQLNFDLKGNIPRHWFGGDPFKTRFFDAMSTMFPEGEKFFINCVRDYRDQIKDPQMREDVKNFIRQEGQHTMVHRQYNDRLKAQGIDCDWLEGANGFKLERFRRVLPRRFTLSMTAAAEHLTAVMSHGFFKNPKAFVNADSRMHAVYMWHGVEEIEHKAVAYDVLKDIAGVGYVQRVTAMALLTIFFPHRIVLALNHMLEVDGYKATQRAAMWLKGLWWLFSPGGLLSPMLADYFDYYKPGYHPWQHDDLTEFRQWLASYERDGDPVAARDALQELALAKAA